MHRESVKKAISVRRAFSAGTLLAGAVLTAASLSGCGTESEDGDAGLFRYDSAKGQCRNGQGQIGFNPYTLGDLRASRNAECVNLSGLDLILLKKDAITFENDTLLAWNFKGARFNECGFHFNNIIDGQLQGADFSGSRFGYVRTTGVIDKFTKPPADDCTVTGNRMECSQ
jgi:uncharacterized protein YjbI with pentapeptide repeats